MPPPVFQHHDQPILACLHSTWLLLSHHQIIHSLIFVTGVLGYYCTSWSDVLLGQHLWMANSAMRFIAYLHVRWNAGSALIYGKFCYAVHSVPPGRRWSWVSFFLWWTWQCNALRYLHVGDGAGSASWFVACLHSDLLWHIVFASIIIVTEHAPTATASSGLNAIPTFIS